MPSLEQLTGGVKVRSDISSRPNRLRYLQSNSVGPGVTNGKRIRFTLPRQNAGYLDMSTLRMRGKLNVTTSDPSARLGGHDAVVLLDRVRCVQGSKVMYDQELNGLISNFTNAQVSVSDIEYKSYERALSDYPQDNTRLSQENTVNTPDRIVICTLGPRGGFLNQNSLMPLSTMTLPVHIDLYFADPKKCFKSSDADLTYTLNDLELNYSSLFSKSLDQYYGSKRVSVHATEHGHRYNYINTGSTSVNLLVPSNASNCSGVLSFLRIHANVNDITQEKYDNAFLPATFIQELDYRIGTRSIFDEPLSAINEYYDQIHHLYPEISKSRYFTPDGFKGPQHVISVNLSGAPSQFGGVMEGSLISGVSSSQLVTDMSMKLTFNAASFTNIQCDHFVLSDIVYSYSKGIISVEL